MNLTYIETTLKYTTLKQVLKQEFKISTRLLKKLKNANQIYLNGKNTYLDHPLKKNDKIIVNLEFYETSEIIPTKMNLNILYEDEAYIIINKPANIPVHPSSLHFNDSLSNGLQYYFNENNINKKIRPVIRLDKNTSGIVIFAKNEYIQECLINQMKENQFIKEYIGILEGNFKKTEGIINAPIARKAESIIERCISENGKESITKYKLIKNFDNYCLVKFTLETGRTHQIRVHCKYINHPILGDFLYGTESKQIARQALHAYKVSFTHPITKTKVSYIAPIPDDMQNLIKGTKI